MTRETRDNVEWDCEASSREVVEVACNSSRLGAKARGILVNVGRGSRRVVLDDGPSLCPLLYHFLTPLKYDS